MVITVWGKYKLWRLYETTKFVLSLLLDSNAQLLFRSGNTEECTFLYIFNDYNLWSHQLLSSIRIVSTYTSIDIFLMKNLHDVQNILSRYSNTDIKISKASYSISVCIFLSRQMCTFREKNIMYKKCSMLNRYYISIHSILHLILAG